MPLEPVDRIHIAPMGFEKERVIDPAEKFNADRVLIVGHDKDNSKDEGFRLREEAKDELERAGIACEIAAECDIFDLFDSLGTFVKLILEHENEELFFNVSTGSKITAIAGMIACMVTEGADPYYVRVTDYDGDTPANIENYTEIPQYPIEPPHTDELKILRFIENEEETKGRFPTKKSLIEFANTQDLEFISRSDAGDKGKYRLLDNHVLEPLMERAQIRIKKDGRSKRISITSRGRDALRAFGYLIEEGQQPIIV